MDGRRFHMWTIHRRILPPLLGNQGRSPTLELVSLVTRARLYEQKAESEIRGGSRGSGGTFTNTGFCPATAAG